MGSYYKQIGNDSPMFGLDLRGKLRQIPLDEAAGCKRIERMGIFIAGNLHRRLYC